MRRVIGIAATASALAAALFVGPLGSQGAAPFVYGCVPVSLPAVGSPTTVLIYNGSGATANITMRLLAFDGTNLSAAMAPTPQTFTIPATTTKVVTIVNPPVDSRTNNTAPLTARIVSDQSIAAEVTLEFSGEHPLDCNYLHP